MKKRALSLALAVLMLLSFVPASAMADSAASGSFGEDICWTLDSSGVLTISGVGKMDDYYYEDGHSVPWEMYSDDIREVVIGSGITSICDSAFSKCAGLLEATIPEGLEKIGSSAFYGCTSLTQISIPDSVTYIGYNAFEKCSKLADIHCGSNISSIGIYAFDETAYYNDEANWNNGILYLGDYLIKAKRDISGEVRVTEGTKCLADDAFAYCKLITGVVLPNSISVISNAAFEFCTELKYVELGESIEQINNYAFKSCKSLTDISLPYGLEEISWNAFERCSSLKSIYIPGSVKSIGMQAFQSCTALDSVSGGTGVYDLGDEAFKDTAYYNDPSNWENGVLYLNTWLLDAEESLKGECTVREGTALVGQYAFLNCKNMTSAVLPDSVAVLNYAAFGGCSGMKHIIIGTGLETIGSWCFAGCSSLSDVYYCGTALDWQRIKEGCTNHNLDDSIIHYDYVWHEHIYQDDQCTVCGIKRDPDYKEPADPTPAASFTDVADTAYYATPVAWAVANNITGGYSDNTFRPMNVCTRAQIVTFLWRANGSPEPQGTSQGFNDVFEGTYYYKAVLWAAEEGITGGFNDGGFHPDEFVTRAQAMTFLWRANGKPAVPEGTVNSFTDVPETAYYHDAVLWAVANGVTGGYDASTFGSMDGCTRAQIVTFLYRDMAQ